MAMSASRSFYALTLSILFLIFASAIPLRTTADAAKDNDNLFLQEAANNASWMVTLGELAHQQAASGDVRQYGIKMAADYQNHINELNLLAGQKAIFILPDTNIVRQNTTQYFRQKSGADFDRNYISLMVEENRSMVSSYQREAQKGLDTEIRAFAYEKIKILEGYVAWAHQILQDLPKPLLK